MSALSPGCSEQTCTCWFPQSLRPKLTVCGGFVEVWDQTIGCPECGENLWSWERWYGDVCMDEAFRRFMERHPFQFDDCSDPGDEDAGHWESFFRPEPPVGGWRFPSYEPAWHKHPEHGDP